MRLSLSLSLSLSSACAVLACFWPVWPWLLDRTRCTFLTATRVFCLSPLQGCFFERHPSRAASTIGTRLQSRICNVGCDKTTCAERDAPLSLSLSLSLFGVCGACLLLAGLAVVVGSHALHVSDRNARVLSFAITGMFFRATSFTGGIDDWDTSSVTDMQCRLRQDHLC